MTHLDHADGSQALFDAIPVASFVIDLSGKVSHVNQACVALFGIPKEQLLGQRSIGVRFYGDERPLLADLIIDPGLRDTYARHNTDGYTASSTIDGAIESERFVANLGQRGRWLFMCAAPVRDRDGVLTGAIETLQDVTDRRRAKDTLVVAQKALTDKLDMAQQHLVHSDKLSSIGQLAAGVAHEINNPIGYVFSNLGTLQKYLVSIFEVLAAYEAAEQSIAAPGTVAELKKLRQRVELDYLKEDIPALMRESLEGAKRVRKIVQDLKEFSHVDSTHDWHFANLIESIDSTLNVVNNEIKYKADIVRQFAELPEVYCRVSEINQVIMNLLVNAAHAIDSPRGNITIATGVDGDCVWFSVSDDGPGMRPEVVSRIFEPFFTTKAVGKGTGLGLFICYGIIKKHRGRIDVTSQPGKGSSFKVTLPINKPAGAGTGN